MDQLAAGSGVRHEKSGLVPCAGQGIGLCRIAAELGQKGQGRQAGFKIHIRKVGIHQIQKTADQRPGVLAQNSGKAAVDIAGDQLGPFPAIN